MFQYSAFGGFTVRERIKMQTRAQASGARSSPAKMMDPVVRPNARRLRKLAHHSILNMEDRIIALEGKDVLTDTQAVSHAN